MPSIRLDVILLLCATLVAPPTRGEEPTTGPQWRPLGDPYWEGAAWTARAEALRASPAEATKALEEAARAWRAAGAPREEAHALASVGTLLNGTGQPKEALPRFEEALRIARAIPAPALQADALNGIGESRALQFELQDAFDAFTELLALQRRLENGLGEVEALGNLGYVYLLLGDYFEAAESFRRALEAARRHGVRAFEATLLNNLGEALRQNGDLKGARARFEEGLALRSATDPGRAYLLVNLGGIHRATGDVRGAIGMFEAALGFFEATGNRLAQATTLDNLGWAYLDLGDADRAVALHTQAMATRADGGESVKDFPSLHSAAKAELHRGRPEDARRLSERALSLVESVRNEGVVSSRLRSSLLAPTRLVYEGYVDALMRLHAERPGDALDGLAFEVAERARARSLLELLAAEGRTAADPPERWAQPLTLAEMRSRALLDRDTVVLSYMLGDDRSHVWAWTGDSIVAHELPARARIDELALRAHHLLSVRPGRSPSGPAELERSLAELSQVLLEPVAPQLGSRRIAVVADGPLHYVPFGALPDPARPGRPLLLEHEIVTLPSVSALAMLREPATGERAPTKGVAVFADPVFDANDDRVQRRSRARTARTEPGDPLVRPSRLGSSVRDVDGVGDLGRLPFTRDEARKILALAGPRGSRGALGFDANLQAVLTPDLADFRYVHFATHGLLNNDRPELSGLVLSLARPDGRPREGFLSVEEIRKLRWRAELVTLSGCRTGLGRSVRGEGLVGMTRAFMVAGAPRVVASLWSVDDSATADLMKGFYAELLGPAKRSPAAALRKAQLDLRRTRRGSAPYYWAAFQLHGDWR